MVADVVRPPMLASRVKMHAGEIFDLAVLSEGRHVASAGGDGRILILNLETEVAELAHATTRPVSSSMMVTTPS